MRKKESAKDLVPIKEFSKDEFRCRCGNASCDYGYDDIDRGFLNRLFTARKKSKVGYTITSAVRCPQHPLAKKNPTSSHNADRAKGKLCMAVDIAAPTSSHVHHICKSLDDAGFTRKGWNQQQHFIHADDDDSKPQEVFFPY